MAWDVEVTDEFASWWSTLTAEQQEMIDARIELVEAHGPSLGRPVVDSIKHSKIANLKELRGNQDGVLRILFVFDPRRTAILLLGGDKTGAWEVWYRDAIPKAETIYAEYLDELREEGLL